MAAMHWPMRVSTSRGYTFTGLPEPRPACSGGQASRSQGDRMREVLDVRFRCRQTGKRKCRRERSFNTGHAAARLLRLDVLI